MDPRPPSSGYTPAPPPAAPPAQAVPAGSGGGSAIAGVIVGAVSLLLPPLSLLLFRAHPFSRLGVLLFLATLPVGIAGVILSGVGLGSPGKRGSAIAGLILSVLGLLLVISIYVVSITSMQFRHPLLSPAGHGSGVSAASLR